MTALPGSLQFQKMEGCGNSFVVLQSQPSDLLFWQARANRICHPGWGIGSDGLLVVLPSSTHDFRVAMFNPDGSEMGMCGNGIRCVTRFVIRQSLWTRGAEEIRYDVEGRSVSCSSADGGDSIRVNMGSPSFDPAQLPLSTSHELMNYPVKVSDREFHLTAVSMGNPHAVIFLPAVDELLCRTYGPPLEVHPLFPRRANIEFARIDSPEKITVFVWERGAGMTLACGTGACATVVAAARQGLTGSSAQVVLPGGSVEVEWDTVRDIVYLAGPARDVAHGEFSRQFLENRI